MSPSERCRASREPVEEFTTEEKNMMLEVQPYLDRLTRTELTAIAAMFIVKKNQHHWKGMIEQIIKNRET